MSETKKAAALAEQPAEQEPFGYFKAEPFGWTNCAPDDEGAIALYEAPQPTKQPLPPQADVALTSEQLTVFKYGWKCAEIAHGITGGAK